MSLRARIASVFVVLSMQMAQPHARQAEALPSLTDADRELITAVLSDATNWRDSEVAPGGVRLGWQQVC